MPFKACTYDCRYCQLGPTEQSVAQRRIYFPVDEILGDAGLTKASDEAKAKALVHWVAQNIRYSGQTMGEGEGFTLHSGEMIFEQRSGVCKDIAGMLIAMMRGAGLDSYAAMTMAGSRIDEVPADQFNHCMRLPEARELFLVCGRERPGYRDTAARLADVDRRGRLDGVVHALHRHPLPDRRLTRAGGRPGGDPRGGHRGDDRRHADRRHGVGRRCDQRDGHQAQGILPRGRAVDQEEYDQRDQSQDQEEEDGDPVAVAYWFTYGDDLETAWFLALGAVEGNQVLMDLSSSSGVGFLESESPVEPVTIEGTLDLTFHNCNKGTAEFVIVPTEGEPAEGEFDIRRLAGLYNSRCSGGLSEISSLRRSRESSRSMIVYPGRWPTRSAYRSKRQTAIGRKHHTT